MQEGIYTKKVMEHFQKPHNYGRMKNPDGVGCVGNPNCGDVMKLYIKVGKPAHSALRSVAGREIIKDIKFETLGCAAAIAVSSVVTDLAKGKTLKEALKINSERVVKALGGLPLVKYHCSLLGADALSEAIYDYYFKNKRKILPEFEKRHQRIMGTVGG